ncbi:hypothetical protein FLA105534_04434 [Flavobacterium bizetiae]|uniref:DUF3995 domain-containing protein n=1 Tax=Flavobacterium bizetiae TaxID=2704140 RepID=A0A6J4GXK6_9FLAO|nr:DUF3995 domain-containing protein [Flavobacterium bizetiae]CAA9203110.1 hypothetical protein FLA105534_04434 [Flavobacterium bizetiae]CAD5344238.1 hypothetical protein FLA105535_04244 [Flavobacterium bizetiae]CAD5350770.1 hypothetical protein FLA105534_04765 [Flavobacterium bizetiae]
MIISLVLFLIFTVLSAIHFYWGFGGKWGSHAVVPTKENGVAVFIPRKVSTFVVAIGLLCFGLFYLIKYDFIGVNLSKWLDESGFWIIASIFIIRAIGDFNYVGLFKKHKSSKFALNDAKYYTPLCLVITVLTLLLELKK